MLPNGVRSRKNRIGPAAKRPALFYFSKFYPGRLLSDGGYLPAGFFLVLVLGTVWVTVSFGWRFTVAVVTKLPVMALRVTVVVFFFDVFFDVLVAMLAS